MPLAPSTRLQHPKTHPPPQKKPCTTRRLLSSFLLSIGTLLFLLLCSRPPCSHLRPGDSAGKGTGLVTGGHFVFRPPPAPASHSGRFSSLAGGWRVQKDTGPCGDTGVTHLALLQV